MQQPTILCSHYFGKCHYSDAARECAFRSPPNAAPSLYIVLQTLRSTAATLATLTALATLTETPSFMLKPTLRAGEEADPNCLHLDVQYSIPVCTTGRHCTAQHSASRYSPPAMDRPRRQTQLRRKNKKILLDEDQCSICLTSAAEVRV